MAQVVAGWLHDDAQSGGNLSVVRGVVGLRRESDHGEMGAVASVVAS